ncbi:MAG: M2 family metallopeptidase [Bacteroidota bacterium]
MKKTPKYFLTTMVLPIYLSTVFYSCGPSQKQIMEKELTDFIKDHESKFIPLSKVTNLASFDASISGKEEDFQKLAELEIELSKIFTSKKDFARIKKIKESNAVTDELLKRQLHVLYNAYLAKQIDEKKLEDIINLQTLIEVKYSNFRAEVDSNTLTDNQIEEILKSSEDSDELKETWLASKKIGNEVNADIIKLVIMRNEIAKETGFDNFHEMKLKLGEQDPQKIEDLFDELDELTKDAFIQLKDEVDDYLSKKCSINKEDLMPWHYQNRYFQEAPEINSVELDKYYRDKDVVKLTETYYKGLGLPIDDILAKSDLYEKEGKNQHAYCTDIDREGDIRVLCNVKPNEKWMSTMLHEFGHAVYDKNIDRNLPYILRGPAHTFTTEAIAMMFGRFASNPQWLKDAAIISDEEKDKIAGESYKKLKLAQLVFSRWAQVMYRFEKSMYENPGQDLNKLWWDLVEKYQMIKQPVDRDEPDWASKIHIALYPCYYHNYLLGELLASQLYYYINENGITPSDHKDQGFNDENEVGVYLKEKIFAPGDRYFWNDMIERATGEKLTPKYFARQFVD